jgi:hypothetical protein
MHSLSTMTAASIGVALATIGAHVVPPEPTREQSARALLCAAAVTACACAWALWRDQLGATMVPYAAGILLLSSRRARAAASGP